MNLINAEDASFFERRNKLEKNQKIKTKSAITSTINVSILQWNSFLYVFNINIDAHARQSHTHGIIIDKQYDVHTNYPKIIIIKIKYKITKQRRRMKGSKKKMESKKKKYRKKKQKLIKISETHGKNYRIISFDIQLAHVQHMWTDKKKKKNRFSIWPTSNLNWCESKCACFVHSTLQCL